MLRDASCGGSGDIENSHAALDDFSTCRSPEAASVWPWISE